MDMQEPPKSHIEFYTTKDMSINIPTPKVIMTINADGRKMRGDKELKELSKEELLTLVDELIDLIRKKQ